MANVNDILKQAVIPEGMLRNEEISDAEFQAYMDSIVPEATPDVGGMMMPDAPAGRPWAPLSDKIDSLTANAPTKMNSVAQASAAKQQVMSPRQYFENAVGSATNKGADSASELELDLRSLSPIKLKEKYGAQAKELMAGQARGERDLLQADTRGSRDATELWDDFSVGLSQSIIGTLGSVAASGAAMLDDDLGTGAAGLLGDFNKFMDESKSNRLQARKDVVEAKHSLTERDNAADFAEKVKANAQIHLAESGVVGEGRADTRQSIRDGSAKLTRELSNFGDAIVNASEDSATFGDGIVNALGSFLAVRPLSLGLAAASGGKLGTVAAIGATEAGGSYVQATNEIMGRTHEQLMETSAPYREMIAGGTDPLDAKQAVANQTGLLSAVVTAPGAMLAGRLVKNFEGNAAAFGSVGKLAGNGAREFTEEGAQGAWGQLSQNLAEQAIIDPNKDLGAGVGRQGGEGALYGLGMSAALAVPGIAKDAAVGTGRFIGKAFTDRVAGIQQANEKASPVSDEKVAQAFAETQASAPVAEEVLRSTVEASDAAPEVKAAANTYVDDLLTASNYDAVEAPPSLAADFEGVTNRHDAIKRAAELIISAEEGSPTQMRAGYYLNYLVQDYTAVVNSDQAAQDAIPADSQAGQIVRQYKALVASIINTPAVTKAVDAVMAQVEAAEAKKVDVTPESLATPEGQQDVQDVLGAAELAPEKVDLETAEKILKQVNLGNLSVTPRQKAAMDTTVALLRAVQESDKAAVASGQATKVGLNVSSVDGEKGYSVTQHAKDIMAAWNSGDRNLAADLLLDLKNFAKGHGNKLAALNAHFAAGDTQAAGLHYNVFAGGKEVKSQKQIAARPHTENGVKLAQQIGAEAKLLADVYNGLVTAFPDLKAEHLAVTPLAGGLVGPVADVMARVKPVTKEAPAPVVKTEDTTPAVKTTPAPVKESAQTGYASLSDADLNAQLNDAFDAVRANPRDRQARAIFDSLDDEMTRREDTAVAQNQQEELDEGQAQSNQSEGSSTTIESYVNHSGGAKGADTAWDSIGRRFGVTKHRHYQKDKTPLGNTTITPEQFQEGLIKAKKAAMMLGRNWSNNPYIQGLLSRNWQQVKNADAVFAIAEKLEGDFVSGGTGYAVAMARAEGKPVFVFDQSQGAWFKASEKGWEQSPTPTLTPNFAGIGTRELTAEGRQAIEDVYAKTKASLANPVPVTEPNTPATSGIEKAIESFVSEEMTTPAELLEFVKTLGVSAYAPIIDALQQNKQTLSAKVFYSLIGLTGSYDSTHHTVRLNMKKLGAVVTGKLKGVGSVEETLSEVILHELIHPAIHSALTNNKEFLAEVVKIQEYLRAKNLSGFPRAALTSPQELLTYALSNVAFQEQLLTVPSMTRKVSVWSDFVSAVRKALGIAALHTSALDDVLSLAEKVMGITQESSSVTPSDTPVAPKVEANTPESVKAQLTEAKQLPFLERITSVNSLLNKEGTSDIVEESAELSEMVNNLLGDAKGFSDAFNKLRIRVSRFISDNLRSRMMDRFDELSSVPFAQQDSGHTQEQIKFLSWLTKLADAQDKKQGDLLNMPEPTVAEKAPAQEPVVEEPAPAKAEPVAKGIAGVFSHLLGGVKNQFIKAFRIPAQQKTRIFSDEGPVSTILTALKDSAAFTAFIGSSPKGKYDANVAEKYEQYLANAPNFLEGLQKRLDAYLNKPYSKKDGRTIGEILATDAEVLTAKGELFEPMRTVDGKALNVAEVVDGKVVYNPELIEGAVLAGLQWLLVSNDYASVVDEKDIAAQTGLKEAAITKGLVGLLSQGLSVGEAKRSLAAKIRNYWGVTGDNAGAKGNIEGIPEAIAAELLAYMHESNDIVELNFSVLESGQVVQYNKADGVPQGHRKPIDRLVPQTKDFPKELRAFPDAIEQAVMVTPEETQFIGEDARPPVAKMQLRNPLVENTDQQKQVMENNGETPYTVDTFMGAFYSGLGKDNFLELFGAGKFDADNMNVNHVLSLEGKNQGTAAAFDHMMGTFERIESVGPIGETPIRYPYNTSRVSRLQMLGKFSPQANKQVRDAILSTWSTLDLSDRSGLDYHRFSMGMAQALGIKIHNQMPETSRTEVQAKLDGPLKPAVEFFQNWLLSHQDSHVTNPVFDIQASSVKELVDAFKQAGVGKPTAAGLHAVMEYARYLDNKDKSSFRTSLYVEADGKTNGPFNAIGLFTTGLFTISDLRVLAKAGMFVNRPGMSANKWTTEHDSEDMYTETAKKLKEGLTALRATLSKKNPLMLKQMDHMLVLLDLFFGKDLSFNDDGDLVIDIGRGVTKNPLTITIYGAGAPGIAGNVVSTLTGLIYERMSEVALAQANGTASSWAEAMFGKTSVSAEQAEAKLTKFKESIDALTNNKVDNYKGKLTLVHNPIKTEPQTPISYTLTTQQLDNMQSTVLELFVAPLRAAIENTVGYSLMATVTDMRMAVQAQSIVMEFAFKAELQSMLDKKAATDPTWKKGDFLTQGEITEAYKKLEHLAPRITTGTQTFYIGGGEISDIATQFGGGLDGSYRTPGFLFGPSDAGVAGIPYLTIGPGDGQMIQNYSIDPDRAPGSLPIFDGIHLPLDQMEKGSIAANKAVVDSLQGNPLAAVHKTFSQFMQDGGLTTMSKEQAKALTRALFPDVPRNKTVPVADIIKRMQTLEQSLNTRQQQIEARHRVFAKVPLSMDQMAAIASPYQQEGTVELEGVEFDELIPQLNAMYEEELAAIKGAAPVRTIAPAVIERGTKHETGVYILNSADIANLTTVFPDNQAAVMKEVVSSLAAEEYTVILGTMANVDAYNAATGREGLSEAEKTNGDVRGYTNFPSKTITLFTAVTETLSHELLHAATFSVLSNHYKGVTNRVITGSVKRLEALMDQFLTLGEELTSTSESFNDTYNNTVAVINGYLANGSQAAALNEFMAWTLTNEQLARLAKRTTATKLGRIKDGIIAAIKAMFGIQQDVGKDMFSNLLFNTSILMHSQPSLAQQFANNNLHQSSIYGTSERLSDINEALNKTVGRYLETPVRAGNIDETSALMTGIQNGYRVAESFMAHGFDMTPQESSTFITIVTALSTEAAIDPNAMAGVQQLYAHVMKGLSVESFMADPVANDPNDRAQAAEKFDVLSGKYLVTRDLAGRSSLLPSFLALATTNDEFRAVLAKIALPKTAKDKSGTLDALLENFGNMLMDKLGQRMQGTKKATNVQQAIDLLNAYMAQVINRRDTFISTMASKPGGVVDITNDKVVGAMQWLSKKAMKLAKPSLRAEASRMEKAAGGALAGFAALIDDSTANAVAEATMTAINKTKMWTWVHTAIGDLVGRTADNALIFDMIKIVRATVQRTRQQYRENLPVALAKKFSRELTKDEKAILHRWARTDVAALGTDALTIDRAAAITALEADLSSVQHWKLIQAKAKQLATYMNTRVTGHNLLRNPDAIAHLLNENVKVGAMADTAKLDRLITLYALESLSQEDKDTLVSLAQDEKEGMNFTLAYLQGQRAEEQRKANGNAKFNLYKGYVPSIQNESASMIVADDTEYATLIGKSYVRIGNYYGSSAESEMNKGYYFIPVAARTTFEQGIMQNVHQTAGGVDAVTGFSSAQMAGRITHPAYVKQLSRRMQRQVTGSPLLPVFNEQGEVIAYERSLDPAIMERTLGEQDLHKAIGQWRGRQVEEGFSQVFNNALMTNLKTMYERDLRANPDNARQYVDVLASKDPVIRDAVRLMNHETKAMAKKLFGETLMVRRELLYDVMGYRAASLGDAWTGMSRWSPATLMAVRNVATAAFGNDAYKTFMRAEKMIQNVVSDAKVLVVVKSVVVPMANLVSNFLQLVARGVPTATIMKAMPKKLAEVETYTRSLVRLIEAEAELRASGGDARVERKLKTEIQAINDDHRRMSIWPLIAAGEFSGIADAGVTRGITDLTSGRLQAYMENAAAKLPGWGSTVGRYALVTKDTALYAALQKSVEYGDFLSKAILYDHYIGKKGMTKAEALAEITEEYVHYDRLPGRDRGALENFGMLWFYNYKIRSVKTAASMIRNNPVHTFLATLAPMPEFFGSIELPTESNLISKLMDGTLVNSIGPGQGLHSAMLNPWVNLTQ